MIQPFHADFLTGTVTHRFLDEIARLIREQTVNPDQKLILGLIWTIILRYHIQKGKKENAKNALLEWVRSKIPEYDVRNFDKSWADGLALCVPEGGAAKDGIARALDSINEGQTLGEALGSGGFPNLMCAMISVAPAAVW